MKKNIEKNTLNVKTLIVLMGISGCGKSTWLSDKSPVVETDDLRKELYNNVSDIENDFNIFQVAQDRIIELFNDNDIVYFGSTMVETKYRLPWLKELRSKCNFKIEFEIIVFESDPKVSKERISKDLSNGKDRADSLDIIDEQYAYYLEAKSLLKKENIYKFIHYV